MASSATHTTANLSFYRNLISQWEANVPKASQVHESNFPSTGSMRDGKEVIVAFRTRPPLEGEADSKFGIKHDLSTEEKPEHVEFCPGVGVQSSEPGVMVAHWHVPGQKVRVNITNFKYVF
jgi:kinesin family member 2/24